jgi:hypothetical protein
MAAHPTGLVVTAVSARVARGRRRADPPCHADGRADTGGTKDRSLDIRTFGQHLAQPARSQPFGARWDASSSTRTGIRCAQGRFRQWHDCALGDALDVAHRQC